MAVFQRKGGKKGKKRIKTNLETQAAPSQIHTLNVAKLRPLPFYSAVKISFLFLKLDSLDLVDFIVKEEEGPPTTTITTHPVVSTQFICLTADERRQASRSLPGRHPSHQRP